MSYRLQTDYGKLGRSMFSFFFRLTGCTGDLWVNLKSHLKSFLKKRRKCVRESGIDFSDSAPGIKKEKLSHNYECHVEDSRPRSVKCESYRCLGYIDLQFPQMRPENSHKPETRDFQFEGIYAFLEFSNAIFSGSFSWLREILADFLQILFLRIFDGEGNFKDQESRRKSGQKVQW